MFVHADQWLSTPPPRICRHSAVGTGFQQDVDQPDTPPAARAMEAFATGERVSENEHVQPGGVVRRRSVGRRCGQVIYGRDIARKQREMLV